MAGRPGAAPVARSRGLMLAAAAAMTALAILLRLARPDVASPLTALFACLVAAALLCAAALSRRRSPAVAGVAAVLAAAIASTETVGDLRQLGLLTDEGRDVPGLLLAVVVLAVAAGTAAIYATTTRESSSIAAWERVGIGAVWLAAGVTVAAAAWTLLEGTASEPGAVSPVRWTGRLAVVAVAVALVVGVARDLAPGLTRAWSAWRARPEAGRGSGTLLGLVAEELLPWGAASERRHAREAERARLAADLHAHVLPDLRRAAALAEAPDAPEEVRAGVRRALEDVERLLQGRQSIVLEEFGLVAALEWLAERTEQSTGLRVELELEGARVDAREAVRRDVERAAFRIALLALDNVVRHAAASATTVHLTVEEDVVELSVVDDGASRADPARSAGRGLADMQREADATGGTLHVTPPPAASVTARWRGAATA